MAKKGNLFLLIKSLSKAEKRYIKVFSNGGKDDSIYQQLFDVIDQQKEYDEEEIRKVFKGDKFLEQLHVTKIYLSELILKALRNYTAKNNINTELLALLGDIEILFGKELYDLCFYKIEKVERLANEYEKFGLLYETLFWKRKLMLTNYGESLVGAGTVTVKEKEVIGKMQSLNSYWDYTLNLFSYLKSDKNLVKGLFFSNEDKATSLQAKALRYHVLYTSKYINGQSKEAEKIITEFIDFLEMHPRRIEEDPSTYITAISNKIGFFLGEKRWKEATPLIKKIKEVPTKYKLVDSSKFTVRLWLRVYNVELELYRDSKQLDKGMSMIEEVSEFINAHKKAVPNDYFLLLYFQFANICFLKKEFSKSLKWINEIINGNFSGSRIDIQAYARILNLIVHFELDNIIVLRYAVDSCKRFLKKNKKFGEYEENILLLFGNLSHAGRREIKTILLESYKSVFEKNVLNKGYKSDYIDVKWWIESKI